MSLNRKIKPGCEKQYDDWLRRFLMLEKNIPGYVETTIITQGGTDSTIRHIIHRFSNTASLDSWEKSDEYLKQIEEANKYYTIYILREGDWSRDMVHFAGFKNYSGSS
ncbi:MAG: hypothetical protein WA364_11520 [Candidatus Nitrosopolaris sp.]